MGGVGTRGRRTNAVLYIYIYPRASDNKTNFSLSLNIVYIDWSHTILSVSFGYAIAFPLD